MTNKGEGEPVAPTQADTIREAARSGEPDRYLSALLAPHVARDDLITLAAFAAEIDKIGRQVHDAYLGEIRLQWWREALCDRAPEKMSGHPVADAFESVIRRRGLSRERLGEYFDASVHRLFSEPPENDTQLTLAISLIEGTLFAFAAQIIGASSDAADTELIENCAQAYGRARLALDLPYALAAGRNPLPNSFVTSLSSPDWRAAITELCASARVHLAHARPAFSAASSAVKSALLPVALVEPYLRVISRQGHDPARDVASIAPLTRTWRLAKCHVLGRL